MEVEKTKGVQHSITQCTIRLLGSARSTSFLEDLSYRFLTRGVGKWVFNWNPADGCPWEHATIFGIRLMEKLRLSNVFREVKCFFNIFDAETLKRYYSTRKCTEIHLEHV